MYTQNFNEDDYSEQRSSNRVRTGSGQTRTGRVQTMENGERRIIRENTGARSAANRPRTYRTSYDSEGLYEGSGRFADQGDRTRTSGANSARPAGTYVGRNYDDPRSTRNSRSADPQRGRAQGGASHASAPSGDGKKPNFKNIIIAIVVVLVVIIVITRVVACSTAAPQTESTTQTTEQSTESAATSTDTGSTDATTSTTQTEYLGVEDKWVDTGYFSTGDKELDQMVKDYCDPWVNDSLSREDNAYNLYNHVCWEEYIERDDNQDPQGPTWAITYAKQLIQENGGNCYNLAAFASYVLRYFGYDATAQPCLVEKQSGNWGDHGLVIVETADGTKFCDCAMGSNGWMLDNGTYNYTIKDVGQGGLDTDTSSTTDSSSSSSSTTTGSTTTSA